MELDGYIGALGQLPSYDQLRMNALAIRGEQQRQIGETQRQQFFAQQAPIALRQQQAELAEQEAFRAEIKALGENATPEQYARMAARYPMMKGIATAAEQLGEQQRRQVVSAAAQINQALANNRPDLAKAIVQRSIDADKASGNPPDPEDLELIRMLDSGDPEQIKAAKGTAYAIVASANPDTAGRNLGEYGATGERRGQVVGRSIGHYDDATGEFVIDYRDPEGVDYIKVQNGDGSESLVEVAKGGGQASGGAGATGGGGPATSGRTVGGWTPRKRNGGDNDDRAVDSKIAGMAGKLGISATTPFPPGMSNMQIAEALTLSEGGPGSIADRNNNPGNIRDPKTGAYRKFPTRQAGIQAAAAQVARNRSRGQNTIATMVEGLPASGGSDRGKLPNERSNTGPKVVFTSKPGNSNPVDQATVDFYAEKIAAGGDLPALGSGKEAAAWRQAILRKAAAIQSGRGLTGGDSNLAQADVKAARSALLQAQKQYTSIVGFEDTFQRNVDQVLKLAPTGVAGGVPVFNRWIQSGRKNVKGDPAVSAFNVAINTAANEYAKLASGASGGAVTSDSARHEAMEILNNAMTLPQLQAAIRQMKIDGHNRVVALDGQIRRLRSGIRDAGKPGSAQPDARQPAPAGGQLVGTYKGKPVYQLPNGKRLVAR